MPLVNPAQGNGQAAGASSATASSSAPAALGGMGSDTFLKLLVAQMRYQNPMSPQDGSQYLQQVSQYAMVEQLQKMTEGQEQVTAYQRALMATAMVGKVVSGTGETGNPLTGTVLRVEYRAGKPALVTSAGTIDLDSVDGAGTASGSDPTKTPSSPDPTNTPSDGK